MATKDRIIGIYEYKGEDFKVVFSSEGWRIGVLNNSERFSAGSHIWERHMETDEVFVLLTGAAVLFAKNDGKTEKLEMLSGRIYNIPRAVWHHIVVADDNTTVLVIENSNTGKSNTEYDIT